jgi:hypothetical protein
MEEGGKDPVLLLLHLNGIKYAKCSGESGGPTAGCGGSLINAK